MCNNNQCLAVLAIVMSAVGGVLHLIVSENYATERMMWETTSRSTNSEDYREYLKNYPNGRFAKSAENRLEALQTHQPPAQVSPIAVPTSVVSSPVVIASPRLPSVKATTPTSTLTPNLPSVACTERMVDVPASTYYRPQYWEKWVNTPTVQIDAAFAIQDHEVTVAEFKQYYNSLDDAAKESISDVNSQADDKPITRISWQVANAYALWLNENNHGCKFSLPSVIQWQAAALKHAQFEEPVVRRSGRSVPSGPLSSSQNLNLLGNVQEWTQDSCDTTSGHLIVGADFKTKYDSISAQPRCIGGSLDTIGLRLVHNGER